LQFGFSDQTAKKYFMLYLLAYMALQLLQTGVFVFHKRLISDTATFSGCFNSGEENEERGTFAKTAGP